MGTPVALRQSLFGRRVVFHLADQAAPFVENLKKAEGVLEVEAVDNKLIARVAEPEKQNPDIIRQLIEAGVSLQFVGEIRHSLEDVYLQLLKEEENE